MTERIAPPTGEVLEPLDEDAEVRAAARALQRGGRRGGRVCFLFSYLNPSTSGAPPRSSQRRSPARSSPSSADIFPQFREFERFTTACMNAFVGPTTGRYLERLADALAGEGVPGKLHVMMSNGGVASRRDGRTQAGHADALGPGGGCAWRALGGRDTRAVNASSPSTSAAPPPTSASSPSTDISEASARDTWVAGYPLLVPMIDIHTIGAGGGSIAHVDEGGAFRVGPRSAGASPGPGRLRPGRRGADVDRRERRPRQD